MTNDEKTRRICGNCASFTKPVLDCKPGECRRFVKPIDRFALDDACVSFKPSEEVCDNG